VREHPFVGEHLSTRRTVDERPVNV
jgi:hypothetical protein